MVTIKETNMSKILDKIGYATDYKKFYDLVTKKAVSDSELETRLLLEGFNISDCVAKIQTLKQNGKPWADLYRNKPAKKDLKEHQLVKLLVDKTYTEVKPNLPFVYVKKSNGSSFPFLRKNENEVAAIVNPETKSLVNALQTSRTAYETLQNTYTESAILNQNMTFTEFMNEIFIRLNEDLSMIATDVPKFITWKKGELAFKYFDPSVLVDGPTPYFDGFCKRLDYPEVFRAWVWSIFEPGNNGRQVLWIQGGGNDGKSTIFRAICNFIGTDHSNIISDKQFESQFFFNEVYGRVLLAYGDCKSPKIFDNEEIQNITGGDEQVINGKYSMTFKAPVYSKVIIGSNMLPEVAWHLDYQSTRMIVLHVTTIENNTGDGQAVDIMTAEMPAFLKKCRKDFEKLCPSNSNIKLPESLVEKMHSKYISIDVTIVREFVNNFVEFGANYTTTKMDLFSEVSQHFGKYKITKPKDLSTLIEVYIKSVNNKVVGPVEVLNGTGTTLGYKGFRIKDPAAIQPIKKETK